LAAGLGPAGFFLAVVLREVFFFGMAGAGLFSTGEVIGKEI
jgi:hypothetical protein